MKRCRILIAIGLAALIGAPFVVPLFSPWSRINCQEYELDLVSGKQRITRFIYWVPMSRKNRDTVASLALNYDPSDQIDTDFVRTSTFGPFTKSSPHYVYHSAPQQVKMLEWVWEEFGYDLDARRDSAQELLLRLKTSSSDSIGDEYLRELTGKGEQDGTGNPLPDE